MQFKPEAINTIEATRLLSPPRPPSHKDGSTQALQRQPRVLRYAIALQVHPPEKHGRFGLARRFRLLQVLQRPWLSP